MAADLYRLLRDARPDRPASMRALAVALAREGYRDGVLRQFELTWWAPSGVALRPAVVFEGGRGHARFRATVMEPMGYHLHLSPDESWAEAEIALCADTQLIVRTKVLIVRRGIFNDATRMANRAEVLARVEALRREVDEAVDGDVSMRAMLAAEALAGAASWLEPDGSLADA